MKQRKRFVIIYFGQKLLLELRDFWKKEERNALVIYEAEKT